MLVTSKVPLKCETVKGLSTLTFILIRLGKQVSIDDKKQRNDDKLKLLTLNVSPTYSILINTYGNKIKDRIETER